MTTKGYRNCIIYLILLVSLTVTPSVALAADQVLIETTKGQIVLALDTEAAPKTVENFLAYVRDGQYQGTIFHRVIPGFMIQGGGFTAEMQQKKTRPPVLNEADNGLKNEIGTIAMARTRDPHSATAQFFINVADNKFLNHRDKTINGWGYCVFGKVVEGMETVKAIENTPTGKRANFDDVPLEPIIIKQMSIIKTE